MKSKHKKEKLYWSLIKLSEENDRAQSALGYKPLDKPIPHGYDCHWKLRKDISNREDAWVFEAILEHLGKGAWSKSKDFRTWNNAFRRYDEVTPYIQMVDESYYNNLYPAVQHWFEYAGPHKDTVRWGGITKWYTCSVPEYFYDKVITRSFKTHYKVIDEVLKQEEAEIEDRLSREFYGQRWRSRSAPKWYCKTFSKKEKNRTNVKIRKAMISGLEEDYDEIVANYNHKHCANWYWW